jgi:hypothetical protein
MTGDSQASQDSAATTAASGNAMRFTVDGWDPAYGTSLELEDFLEESTAVVDVNVELPADRWQAIDPDAGCLAPEALLFVDGVRRVEARVWIDENSGINGQATQASAAYARHTRQEWCAAAASRLTSSKPTYGAAFSPLCRTPATSSHGQATTGHVMSLAKRPARR